MDVTTRNRTDLKSYFVKNSVPTESNFAELIDGMLNQIINWDCAFAPTGKRGIALAPL